MKNPLTLVHSSDTIEVDEVSARIKELVETMPAGYQFSMFDILESTNSWFNEAIEELEKKDE